MATWPLQIRPQVYLNRWGDREDVSDAVRERVELARRIVAGEEAVEVEPWDLPVWCEPYADLIYKHELDGYQPAPWCQAFLHYLGTVPSPAVAARKVEVNRTSAYRYADHHPWFKKAWEDAVEDSLDSLQAEAYKRAIQGVDEPVFYRGTKIATVKKPSDTLLMFLLNNMRFHTPEQEQVFRHRIEGVSEDAAPIHISIESEEEYLARTVESPDEERSGKAS